MTNELKQISVIYKSTRTACGINIFNKHLVELLTRHGYLIIDCNLAERKYKTSPNTILHYVPSMWANDQGELTRLIKSEVKGHLHVIVHGIYTPHETCYLQETKCPELNNHIEVILSHAKTIIALSESCMAGLWLWKNTNPRTKFITFSHPGIYCAPEISPKSCSSSVQYAFIGGVIRPKKDIRAQKLHAVLKEYRKNGIPIWAHCSNFNDEFLNLPLWRVTQGMLDDRKWSTILTNSSVVLCPYETKIQCVSGLVAEALSIGKPIIATDFPFAREMKMKYPDYISIEDDLSKWAQLTLTMMTRYLQRPIYPNWNDFNDIIVREIAMPEL